MVVVLSDDKVTINGVEVIIPYADEPPLTSEQMAWLTEHNIQVHICRKRRQTYNTLSGDVISQSIF